MSDISDLDENGSSFVCWDAQAERNSRSRSPISAPSPPHALASPRSDPSFSISSSRSSSSTLPPLTPPPIYSDSPPARRGWDSEDSPCNVNLYGDLGILWDSLSDLIPRARCYCSGFPPHPDPNITLTITPSDGADDEWDSSPYYSPDSQAEAQLDGPRSPPSPSLTESFSRLFPAVPDTPARRVSAPPLLQQTPVDPPNEARSGSGRNRDPLHLSTPSAMEITTRLNEFLADLRPPTNSPNYLGVGFDELFAQPDFTHEQRSLRATSPHPDPDLDWSDLEAATDSQPESEESDDDLLEESDPTQSLAFRKIARMKRRLPTHAHHPVYMKNNDYHWSLDHELLELRRLQREVHRRAYPKCPFGAMTTYEDFERQFRIQQGSMKNEEVDEAEMAWWLPQCARSNDDWKTDNNEAERQQLGDHHVKAADHNHDCKSGHHDEMQRSPPQTDQIYVVSRDGDWHSDNDVYEDGEIRDDEIDAVQATDSVEVSSTAVRPDSAVTSTSAEDNDEIEEGDIVPDSE